MKTIEIVNAARTIEIVNAARENHASQIRALAEFCLEKIVYKDHGNKEDYTLYKDGKELKITAAGGREGGFLSIHVKEVVK